MLAYVWHKHVLSVQLEISLPTLVMHWLRFCCADPQVVPLTVAGVKLVGVKAADEAAVESVGDGVAVELLEAGAAEVLAAVEVVLFVA